MNVSKLVAKLRRRGVVYSIAMAIYRYIPAWLFRFTVLDVLEMDSEQANKSDFGWRSGLKEMKSSEERRRLRELTYAGSEDGAETFPLGFGLTDDETKEPVGGLWIGEKQHHEPSFGLSFLLPKNAGWLFAATLQKERRGKGEYNDLLVYALRTAGEKRTSPIFLAISPVHNVSAHVHGKFSRRKVGRVFILKLLGFAWLHAKGDLVAKRTFTLNCTEHPNLVAILPTDPPVEQCSSKHQEEFANQTVLSA